MTTSPPASRRATQGLLTALALGACIAGAAFYLVPQARRFLAERPRIELGALVLASASYALFGWASARQMRACLMALGATTRRPYAVFALATLGKYLPTKAMVPVVRARLTAPEGASATVVIAALGLEFVIGGVVGTWLGLTLTAESLLGLGRAVAVGIGALGLLVLAFAGRPRVIQGLRALVEMALARVPGAQRVLPAFEPRHAVRAAAWAALAWIAGGTSLALCFRALGGGHGSELGIGGSFALASMAGYLAFVVPAGLGVREAGLLGLLGPHLGAPIVSAAVLAHRVLGTATELVAGGIAALWLAYRGSRRPVGGSAIESP